MKFLILFMLISALLATACTPAVASNTNSLANTQWVLVSFGQPGTETPVVAGSNVTLAFEENNQAGGSGGCNSYGGQYEEQNNTLSFSEIVSTLMACADPAMMDQEQAYFEALQSTGRFELSGNQLKIWYDSDQGVLNFVRATP